MSKPKLNRPVAPIIDCLKIDYVTISNEEFQQLLDEWAEIVYCHLCQLSEEKTLVTETLSPLAAERTGTNGSKK